MPSLHLDTELDERVRRAAAVEGESVSEFLRRAAAERADRSLGVRVSDQLRDVLGVVDGGGGCARRSGEAFAEALADHRARR